MNRPDFGDVLKIGKFVQILRVFCVLQELNSRLSFQFLQGSPLGPSNVAQIKMY
jgi:hypothetical protein